MKNLIRVPFLGANDTDCELVEWLVGDGESVKSGVTLCAVETTKATNEIHAEFDGYLYQIAELGQRLAESEVVGLLSTEEIADVESEMNSLLQEEVELSASKKKVTKKAEILIKRNHLLIDNVLSFYDDQTGPITEELVDAYLEAQAKSESRLGFENIERVAVIGGASGGGALIVLDSLLRSVTQQAVAVFDQNVEFHGKAILGVPVVGGTDDMWEWLKGERIDKVVIAFNRNLDERKKVFEDLKSKGVDFCNVIDPTANVRAHVTIGEGNVILGNSYFGACTEIGDNNFISSNVCLEHGNILGSHCAFGPAVATSGNVTIGDQVRFGTGIYIEPEVAIGDGVVVASGSVLRSDVPDRSIVKMKYATTVKPF